MKLRPKPDEYFYAVAIRDGADLWLMLWVKRSSKGEFFVMIPRDGDWDPHASYHRDGIVHQKSFGQKFGVQNHQPLKERFRGTVHLGIFMGHSPEEGGVTCDPTAFAGVVEVAPGILGPLHGGVIVDLVEPGYKPSPVDKIIVQEKVFCDFEPWIVIRIFS
jgi:hypothetical protein